MLNLLPQPEKAALTQEYRLRLAIVILLMSFTTFVVSSILLVPSVLLSSQKEKSAEDRFALLTKSVEKGGVSELEEILREGKIVLKLVSHKDPKVSLSESLMRIVSAKPQQISLNNFSFVRDGTEKVKVDISGVAENRAALLSFEKTLEQTGLFEKVTVPVSNFARDSDIEFTIQTVGIFQ